MLIANLKSLALGLLAPVALLAGPVQASWVETFDDVSSGTTFTSANFSPWVVESEGYAASNAMALSAPNSAHPTWSDAVAAMHRAVDPGANTLIFSFAYEAASSSGSFHNFWASEQSGTSVSSLAFQIDNRGSTTAGNSTSTDTLRFAYTDSIGNTFVLWDIKSLALLPGTWYDGRIIMNGDGTVDLGVKLSSSATWTENNGVSAPDIDFNYLNMSGWRAGEVPMIFVDNVGAIPEPASLVLMGVGCLLVLRRRI